MPVSKAGNTIVAPLIEAKTAAYTVTAQDSRKIFTTRGATVLVTFTLPAIKDVPMDTEYTFYGVSAYGWAVTATAAVILIVNAAATTITTQTASNIIGANMRIVSDGTNWLAFAGQGPTVAAYAKT